MSGDEMLTAEAELIQCRRLLSARVEERDEALRQAKLAWERHAEKDRAYGEALAQRDAAREERDAALADNAALLEMVLSVDGEPGHDYQGLCPDRWQPKARDPECAACRLMSAPHPGAALLEEVATLRGVRAQAQVDAKFIHDALGWAGEWPRSLPAPSRAVVALLKEVTGLRESKSLLQKVAAICRGLQRPDEEALSVLEPLFEEHRKALENEQQRYRNVIARLSEEVAHFTGTLCAADFMAVLNGISRVAVRARNEGLEEAARTIDCTCVPPEGFVGEWHHMACTVRKAAEIRAMKEPES